jgi:hypothetical protein
MDIDMYLSVYPSTYAEIYANQFEEWENERISSSHSLQRLLLILLYY